MQPSSPRAASLPDPGGTCVAEPEAATRPRHAPRYRVLLHNDDVTPMELVVEVLRRVFGLASFRAVAIMLVAHTTGLAHVGTYPLEQAELLVEQAHALARPRGYPLTFTCEAE